jgi:cAMP phosphodiesterase
VILKVLGASGAEFPGCNLPAFLIDGKILLDGGTIGLRLTGAEQWNVRHILVSHAHLDHVRGIPFLADNILVSKRKHSITLYGLKETLSAIRENLLNDRIWPDFTKISASRDPVIKMERISPSRPFSIGDYTVTAHKVSHTIPAVGYIVKDYRKRVLLYTGDTGPTDSIWKSSEKLNTVIAEVSFPNRMEELARKTGHLTARLLMAELEKIRNYPEKVYVTHPKPQYIRQIRSELERGRNMRIEMLIEGKEYEI